MRTTKTVFAVLMLMVTTGLFMSCTDTELDDGTETAITIENSSFYGTDHGDANESTGGHPPTLPPPPGDN